MPRIPHTTVDREQICSIPADIEQIHKVLFWTSSTSRAFLYHPIDAVQSERPVACHTKNKKYSRLWIQVLLREEVRRQNGTTDKGSYIWPRTSAHSQWENTQRTTAQLSEETIINCYPSLWEQAVRRSVQWRPFPSHRDRKNKLPSKRPGSSLHFLNKTHFMPSNKVWLYPLGVQRGLMGE